jgi:hypothetical protein
MRKSKDLCSEAVRYFQFGQAVIKVGAILPGGNCCDRIGRARLPDCAGGPLRRSLSDLTPAASAIIIGTFASVAQLDRALASGARGCGFDPRRTQTLRGLRTGINRAIGWGGPRPNSGRPRKNISGPSYSLSRAIAMAVNGKLTCLLRAVRPVGCW